MNYYVFQSQVGKNEHLTSNNKILIKREILIFLIPMGCYNSKNLYKGTLMINYLNRLFTIVVVAVFVAGCVKPTQQIESPQTTQPVQSTQTSQSIYTNSQQPIYEDASPIIYEDPNSATTSNSGVVYSQIPTDNSVVTTTGYPQQDNTIEQATVVQQATVAPPMQQESSVIQQEPVAPQQPVYTNPYETGGASSYPDPYANSSSQSSTPSYPSSSNYPTSSYPTQSYPTSSYPTPPSYPTSSSASSAGQSEGGGGIHLQVAAFKDYYAAKQFKNSLSLAPSQSAYIKRGPMNKVIVTGISSLAEAKQLKNSRFPGAFIVQGGSLSGSGGYTPPPATTPSYNTGGGTTTTYTVNDPYGTSTSSGGGYSSSSSSGIGVQIGAFSSRAKAQEIANSHHGKHPAVVKKIGRYYKVILTGFSSRSSARAYGSRVGGFVVSF